MINFVKYFYLILNHILFLIINLFLLDLIHLNFYYFLSNLIFIYVICKTQERLSQINKLFIIQSICDLLIGLIRGPINLYTALTQDYFCVINFNVAGFIDLCTWPLQPFSVVVALGIALQRYIVITKKDLSRVKKITWIVLFVVSSTMYILSNITCAISSLIYRTNHYRDDRVNDLASVYTQAYQVYSACHVIEITAGDTALMYRMKRN